MSTQKELASLRQEVIDLKREYAILVSLLNSIMRRDDEFVQRMRAFKLDFQTTRKLSKYMTIQRFGPAGDDVVLRKKKR